MKFAIRLMPGIVCNIMYTRAIKDRKRLLEKQEKLS